MSDDKFKQAMNNNEGDNAEEIFDAGDIEKNKTIAGLAYLIFFLPLIVCPESKFGRFHANQALILFIASVGGTVILSIIPVIGWLLLPLYTLAIFVVMILGLVSGLGGKAKEIPYVGKYRLLK